MKKKKKKGYIRNYMSVRAKEAFDRGEKPWTLWGEKKLVVEIMKKNPGVDREALEAADPDTLKKMYLGYAGWHHMGSDYRETKFYRVCRRDYTADDIAAASFCGT
ncbi:MAG: hypothetical protein LUG27_05425 [Clostridiales bacterium]|nr:hypothetical protein [Clostridiales bacterium]